MDFLTDLKYSIRLLLKNPTFTVLTIAVMAVGLALSIFSFSLLSNLLEKPLALPEGEQIVSINGANDVMGRVGPVTADARDYFEIREQSTSFSDMGAYALGTALVRVDEGTRKFWAAFTEWNMFQFTRVEPILGRGFLPEDNLEGAEPVAVIGYEMWRDYFGEDPDVIDKTFRIEATTTRVVGVMPEGYAFPQFSQIWLPLGQPWLNPNARASGFQVGGYARLKSDVSLSQANQDLYRISQRFQQDFPDTNANGAYYWAGSYPKSVWAQRLSVFTSLYIISALVFLLACINVGNLLLVRAQERSKEIAIRIALGAPRLRLMLQALWESIIICTLAAVLALLLARWGLGIAEDFIRDDIYGTSLAPFWLDLSIGWKTVVATVVITLIALLLTGAVPVWKLIRGDFNSALRDGTRGALGKGSAKLSNVLIFIEIALTCAVLVIAGFTALSSRVYSNTNYGISTSDAISARLELPAENYPDIASATRFYQNLKDNLATPSVESVGLLTRLPGDHFFDGSGVQRFAVEGEEYPMDDSFPRAVRVYAAPGSLQAMGVNLLQGRLFDSRDSGDGQATAVITDQLAKQLWPEQDAIGKRLQIAPWGRTRWMENVNRPWMTVVGVIANLENRSPFAPRGVSRGAVYMPVAQSIMPNFRLMEIMLRHRGNQQQAIKDLLAEVNRLDGDVAVFNLESYDRRVSSNGDVSEALGKIFLICGAIALLLAISGVYAILSNSILQRTQEIGVRRAMGATNRRIIKLFSMKSLIQLAIGLAVGLALTSVGRAYVKDFMPIHQPSLYISLIVVPLIIVAVVMIATYIPTKKAVKLKPSEALRYE